jgi:hypothetical protein
MKRIQFVLLGLFLVSITYSQNNLLSVERNVSEHFVDTLYSQIDFCYSNNSGSTYVLWIERDNVDSLSNLNKIKKHFFTVKGDFSFMGLIWDGNVASFTPGLFDSFMKVIKPKEQFIVSFLKKGEAGMINSMEKQIVIVDANEIRGLQIDSSIDMFLYHAKSVTILDEWLK